MPFLEPTETILLFFDIILYFSIFLICNILVIVLFHKKLLQQGYDYSIRESLKNNWINIKKFLTFVSFTIAFLIMYFCTGIVTKTELLLWIGLIFIGIYINPFFLMLTSSISKASKSVKQIIMLLIITCNICAFAAISGKNEAEKVKNGFYFGSEFKGDSLSIKSDSTYYYLGKTRQYYFFYDFNYEKVEIFDTERISYARMK